MSGIVPSHNLAMKPAGAGSIARQEDGSHLHAFGAERESRDYASCISDPACGNHRHIDDINDLRKQGHRAGERIFRRPQK